MDLAKVESRLREYARQKGITALYVFGSAARGELTQLSDIDLAVLLPQDADPADLFDKRWKMTLDLMGILGTDAVDLVLLNQAPPLLCHRIITEGKLVYSRDEREHLRFEVRKILEYLDFKPILELQSQYMRRRLKEGKFGTRPHYRRTAAQKTEGPEANADV